MSAWADLLFGDGAILGFILINAILFIFTMLIDKFGYFAGIASILLFFYYGDNFTANTFDIWIQIGQIVFAGIYFMIGVSE